MIKTILKSVREYKKHAILTPVFVGIEVIIECIIPFMVAILVNNIKDQQPFSTVLIYGLLLAGLAILSLIFGALAGRSSAIASSGFGRNLRSDLFKQIQSFSFSNIDKFSSSSLVTRLTTDVSNVQMTFMMMIRMAIRSPLMFLFSFSMAYIMGGTMALIFLVTVPIMALGLFLIIRMVMPIFKRMFKRYDKVNNSIQENVKGIRVVKAYVREDYESANFAKATNELKRDSVKAERLLALLNPLMQFCLYTVMVFVLSYGSYVIITSKGLKLDVGQFSALITYSWQILMSLMMVGMVFAHTTMSIESAERIVEVLNEKSTIVNPSQPISEVKDGSIVFDHVNFSYNQDMNKLALKDINLSIQSGETIGIIGGTGSSKTTLVNLISRLYDVTSGAISVGGIDVRNYDLTTLRDRVSVVLQKNVLFAGTIKENLKWGNKNASDEQIIAACQLAQAHDFIMSFEKGYDTLIDQGGVNVSGGQRQRLCIARALLKAPKILILDDSTSAVDTATDAKIRQGFRQTLPHVTKIIIAQRISSISDADRIIVLDKGEVVAIGTHQQLLETSEIYAQVANSQNKGGDFDEQ